MYVGHHGHIHHLNPQMWMDLHQLFYYNVLPIYPSVPSHLFAVILIARSSFAGSQHHTNEGNNHRRVEKILYLDHTLFQISFRLPTFMRKDREQNGITLSLLAFLNKTRCFLPIRKYSAPFLLRLYFSDVHRDLQSRCMEYQDF